MNRSTCERHTGGALIREAPGSWSLVVEDVAFTAQAMKDSLAIKDVHDQFWAYRKKQVFTRDGYKCVKCSSPFHLQCDHKVNRSQGGTHSMENLQTLCMKCHDEKTGLYGAWKKS